MTKLSDRLVKSVELLKENIESTHKGVKVDVNWHKDFVGEYEKMVEESIHTRATILMNKIAKVTKVSEEVEDPKETEKILEELKTLKGYLQKVDKFEPSKEDIHDYQKGICGYMRPKVNENLYELHLREEQTPSEESNSLWGVCYPNVGQQLIDEHVVIHEFAHIYDFVNEATVDYDATIREHCSEFFAEYLGWLIVLGDEKKAKEYATNYATFRSNRATDSSLKAAFCTAEVIYYRNMPLFNQIAKMFKELV